ncbi:MAG: METTL5 family protein [Candidatus Bathyarchaeota archaeon]|nr:METTL5 family protein [Candidatus Bathyarchaeota archaeon]
MGEFTQRRLIRKLELERLLSGVAPQPTPQARLEQYTSSEAIAANLLYLAAYTYGDIVGKSVLDLGCGTGRLGLGAAFLGADYVVGVDVDRLAIKTAQQNTLQTGLADKVQWVLADVSAVGGAFDTVVMNPPFGVQNREADRAFLVKALEVADNVYSFHNHPEVDERLIKLLKSSQGFVQVHPSPFLERFINKYGGSVSAVYAMLMTIPRMFEFHTKLRHDFVIDLYVIKKVAP